MNHAPVLSIEQSCRHAQVNKVKRYVIVEFGLIHDKVVKLYAN